MMLQFCCLANNHNEFNSFFIATRIFIACRYLSFFIQAVYVSCYATAYFLLFISNRDVLIGIFVVENHSYALQQAGVYMSFCIGLFFFSAHCLYDHADLASAVEALLLLK